MRLGRWSWIGHGCKIRVHEGEFSIGAKSVLGQECTISAYQHISIGRECIIADRVMMIDFDHGMVEVERPIREQGIYKRDVDVGHNVWIGYGACLLRGVTVGDNAVVGTSAVVTADVPANAVVGGRPGAVDPHAQGPEDLPLGLAWSERLKLPSSFARASPRVSRPADRQEIERPVEPLGSQREVAGRDRRREPVVERVA